MQGSIVKSFIARQPIFDRNLQVIAYELLFRRGLSQAFAEEDGDRATFTVMRESFLSTGISTLTDGKRAFINCTRDLLVGEYAFLFPKESIVVEVLETVCPDDEVIEACRRLRDAGYTLALDDFVKYDPAYDPLLELAEIVKVDFIELSSADRKELAEFLKGRGVKLVAEKVEDYEEQREALEFGYDYFQGNFFSRPVIVACDHLPESKRAAMQLLRAVNEEEIDFLEVDAIVKSDLALSYGLLRYINSAFFGLRQKVRSIKQGIVLLGSRNLRKWSSLVALSYLADDQPSELVLTSLVRARMCEILAPKVGMAPQDQELFLLGMFSLIDTLLGRSMETILAGMHLGSGISDALLESTGPLSPVLTLILAYERGDWPTVEHLGHSFGVAEATLYESYYEAVDWAQHLLRGDLGQAAA